MNMNVHSLLELKKKSEGHPLSELISLPVTASIQDFLLLSEENNIQSIPVYSLAQKRFTGFVGKL
jgi:hypothetical protein